MSFSKAFTTGTFTWAIMPTVTGNFANVTVAGLVYDEVGYSMGGYGQDGYDAPSVNIQAAPAPTWTAITTK